MPVLLVSSSGDLASSLRPKAHSWVWGPARRPCGPRAPHSRAFLPVELAGTPRGWDLDETHPQGLGFRLCSLGYWGQTGRLICEPKATPPQGGSELGARIFRLPPQASMLLLCGVVGSGPAASPARLRTVLPGGRSGEQESEKAALWNLS